MRALNPFEGSLKPAGPGAAPALLGQEMGGIELAIAQAQARRLGGSLTLSDNGTRGARAALRLPLDLVEIAPAPARPASRAAA